MQQNGVITVITYNYVSVTFNLKPVKERRAEKWSTWPSCCFVGGLQARHGGGVTVGEGGEGGSRKTIDITAARPLTLKKDLNRFPRKVGLHDNVSQKHHAEVSHVHTGGHLRHA